MVTCTRPVQDGTCHHFLTAQGGAHEVSPLLRVSWQWMTVGSGWQCYFSLGMWPVVGCPCSANGPHPHVPEDGRKTFGEGKSDVVGRSGGLI